MGLIDGEGVLMAVHRIEQHATAFHTGIDAGDIALGGKGECYLGLSPTGEVVAPRRHHGIVAAGLRIFIGIFAGIFGILLMLGGKPLEHLQGIGLHIGLIIAYPAEMAGIGGEGHRAAEAELLFVHPVGNAVDDFVAHTVAGHLSLAHLLTHFHQENIIVADEGHTATVGRPDRRLLRSALGEWGETVGDGIVDVVVGNVGTAVDGVQVRGDKDLFPVGTRGVPVDTLDVCALGVGQVEDDTCLLAGGETVADHLVALTADLGETAPVGQRGERAQVLSGILARSNVGHSEAIACHGCMYVHRQCHQAEERFAKVLIPHKMCRCLMKANAKIMLFCVNAKCFDALSANGPPSASHLHFCPQSFHHLFPSP